MAARIVRSTSTALMGVLREIGTEGADESQLVERMMELASDVSDRWGGLRYRPNQLGRLLDDKASFGSHVRVQLGQLELMGLVEKEEGRWRLRPVLLTPLVSGPGGVRREEDGLQVPSSARAGLGQVLSHPSLFSVQSAEFERIVERAIWGES